MASATTAAALAGAAGAAGGAGGAAGWLSPRGRGRGTVAASRRRGAAGVANEAEEAGEAGAAVRWALLIPAPTQSAARTCKGARRKCLSTVVTRQAVLLPMLPSGLSSDSGGMRCNCGHMIITTPTTSIATAPPAAIAGTVPIK